MRRIRVVGLAVFILASVGALLLLSRRNKPIIIGYGDVRDSHGMQILNPFRDKSAERAVTKFMEQLKNGNCRSSPTAMGSNAKPVQTICEREQELPLQSWTLEAQGVDGSRVMLRYRVTRVRGEKRIEDPSWFWVTNESDRVWKVSGYEPWY